MAIMPQPPSAVHLLVFFMFLETTKLNTSLVFQWDLLDRWAIPGLGQDVVLYCRGYGRGYNQVWNDCSCNDYTVV